MAVRRQSGHQRFTARQHRVSGVETAARDVFERRQHVGCGCDQPGIGFKLAPHIKRIRK
jgi:hypothetical protein